MTELDQLRAELDAAVGALLAALEGIAQAEFEREQPGGAIRDVVWRAGLREDWARRAVSHAARSEEAPAYLERPRPVIAETPEYLAAWLEQCHRPMVALLRRLSEDALRLEVTAAEGRVGTVAGVVAELASEMRDAAQTIESLRAEAPSR